MKLIQIIDQLCIPLKYCFRKVNFELERIRTIRPWEYEKDFLKMYKKSIEKSVVDQKRLYILKQLVETTIKVPGDLIELGVYKGGSAYIIGSVANLMAPNKKTHLFDTFGGLPNPDVDLDPAYTGREFRDTSIEEVKKFLKSIKNVYYYQGLFSKTLASVKKINFSFAHIDADLYESVKESCDFLYSRSNPGAVWVFDDYGFRNHYGAKKAVDDFFKDKFEKPILLPTGQAIIFKQ